MKPRWQLPLYIIKKNFIFIGVDDEADVYVRTEIFKKELEILKTYELGYTTKLYINENIICLFQKAFKLKKYFLLK
jgi:hypothetical protein